MNNKIKNLLDFLLSKRKSGTTTLLQKISSENDVYVLVSSKRESDEFFKGNALDLNDLKNNQGLSNKPILIETSLLISLLKDVISEDDNKERIISTFHNFVRSYESEIEKLRAMGVLNKQ